MTDSDRSSGLAAGILNGATLAGLASVLAPTASPRRRQRRRRSSPPAPRRHHRPHAPNTWSAAPSITLTRSKRARSCSSTGMRASTSRPAWSPRSRARPGFPDYGKPGLRREADYILERMGQILKSFGTDFAHRVRLDQYYTDPNAVRAYHLARFAALGKYIPPSTSMITERCFGAREHHDHLADRGGAGAAMGDQSGLSRRVPPSSPIRVTRQR